MCISNYCILLFLDTCMWVSVENDAAMHKKRKYLSGQTELFKKKGIAGVQKPGDGAPRGAYLFLRPTVPVPQSPAAPISCLLSVHPHCPISSSTLTHFTQLLSKSHTRDTTDVMMMMMTTILHRRFLKIYSCWCDQETLTQELIKKYRHYGLF